MSTRSSSGGGGLARLRTGLLVTLVVTAATLALPAFSGPGAEPAGEADIAELVGAALDRRVDAGSERPRYLPEPGGALSTASAPTPMSNAVLVSKTARWGRLNLPYLVADTALPFRYHVDQGLADRFGLDTVVDAMAQWDGIPGSRWATEFASVVSHPGTAPRRDGHPVVYLRHDCPAGYLGTARWNTDPERMHLDTRYGTGALYGTQVDVAVCSQVETDAQLYGLLAHEVGHVMGMAHLCEPGEVCWGGGAGPDAGPVAPDDPRCRPMYSLWGPCRDAGLTERDHEAARHLYPTLLRLHGPSRIETAARASYATTWSNTAETTVLTRADQGLAEALVGAALGGALDAPLLLGLPDQHRCVEGEAATELARVAADGGTVLLAGDWPVVCETVLEPWNLTVERLAERTFVAADPTDSHAARLSVHAAELLAERTGRPPTAAFLAPAGSAAGLDGAIAAAEAGRRGLPLLFTDPAALSRPVARWLARNPAVRQVWIVGSVDPGLAGALNQAGVSTVRLSGSEPVERSTFLASSHSPAGGAQRVVIGPADALVDAVVAASVAARLDAPLLLSPPEADPAVHAWLERNEPLGGYLVGGTAALPYPTQRAYSAVVLPSPDPAPSRAGQRGIELPRLLPSS